jgi:hypothetical protein
MPNIELTPALFSMRVIAQTDDAIYLRLPAELQRDCGGCDCPQCKANPALAKWDTLVVPLDPAKTRDYSATHSGTVHMPDGSVEEFMRHSRRPPRRTA